MYLLGQQVVGSSQCFVPGVPRTLLHIRRRVLATRRASISCENLTASGSMCWNASMCMFSFLSVVL